MRLQHDKPSRSEAIRRLIEFCTGGDKTPATKATVLIGFPDGGISSAVGAVWTSQLVGGHTAKTPIIGAAIALSKTVERTGVVPRPEGVVMASAPATISRPRANRRFSCKSKIGIAESVLLNCYLWLFSGDGPCPESLKRAPSELIYA